MGVEFEGVRRSKIDIFQVDMENCKSAKTFGELTTSLNKLSKRLADLEMFRNVRFVVDQAPDTTDKDDKVIVKIQVEERKCSIRAGTEVQYQDVGLGAGGVFYNIFGRGEKLNVSMSAGSQSATPVMVEFMKPIGGNPNKMLNVSVYSTLQHYLKDVNYKNSVQGFTVTNVFGNPWKRSLRHELSYTMDWRHVHGINDDASLTVRRSAGHSIKSSLTHTVKLASSEMQKTFPERAYLAMMKSEVAGLAGSVSFLKNDLHGSFHLPLFKQLVFSVSTRIGHVLPFSGYKLSILDKYHLGGPLSVRGFALNSLGPKDRNDSIGGDASIETSARLSFPITPSTSEYARLHLFANMGILSDVKYEEGLKSNIQRWINKEPNVSVGAGIQVKITEGAKLELNLGVPIRMQPNATFHRGLQVGIGMDFL